MARTGEQFFRDPSDIAHDRFVAARATVVAAAVRVDRMGEDVTTVALDTLHVAIHDYNDAQCAYVKTVRSSGKVLTSSHQQAKEQQAKREEES